MSSEQKQYKILAVDDEPINLDLLREYIEDNNCEAICVSSGPEALSYLISNYNDVDVVLLDRMMPNMDGIEVLKKMKSEKKLQNIPVIMQTAAASPEEVNEGISAGAYYYLAKPFEETTLVSIINSACREVASKKNFREEVLKEYTLNDILVSSKYKIQTMDEVKKLAAYLGELCPKHEEAANAFLHILTNAVEHGNLEIGYDEKTNLLLEDQLQQEIEIRLTAPENQFKFVEVDYQKTDKDITVIVKDQGKGFDYNSYLEIDPMRASKSHGRGVAIAKLCFDDMQFQDPGNVVVCKINL